jgi:hypothetical protein
LPLSQQFFLFEIASKALGEATQAVPTRRFSNQRLCLTIQVVCNADAALRQTRMFPPLALQSFL